MDDMSILAIVETNPLLTQEQIDYLLSLVDPELVEQWKKQWEE